MRERWVPPNEGMGEIGLRCNLDVGERMDKRFEDGTGNGTASGWMRTEMVCTEEDSQGVVFGGAAAVEDLIVMLWLAVLVLGHRERELVMHMTE
ncbi:hypothetical protein TSUD_283780 [Trifolium subterraneum]|uniref:Uncharacterized protein n=1 Tax=Trifolium subterraneum TaxID=3900 RepID=A0A2Z6PLE4_TRISU|nr:hypothetical protein TSUD_283780 [Trifolium subterraneum]